MSMSFFERFPGVRILVQEENQLVSRRLRRDRMRALTVAEYDYK